MIRKLARRGRDDADAVRDDAAPLFDLDALHERRILSWSPDPEDDVAEDADIAREQPREDPPPPPARQTTAQTVAPPVRRAAPAPVARPAEVPPVPAPAAVEPEPVDDQPVRAAGTRGRGRPRGRPRRQVHFHVDPDEEVLLLAAVEKFGSQQKGLIAALQALQDIEVVRDEVERLAAQCENQRKLLDQAESIFNR